MSVGDGLFWNRRVDTVIDPGDSSVQRSAEPLMLAWLSDHLGAPMAPRAFAFGGRSRAEVDGVSEDGTILCEVWAHQGEPKSAQKFKVMNDAMKLLAVQRQHPKATRLILLFGDDAAARIFRSGTWRAEALSQAGVEVMVADLDEEQRRLIREAQVRQYR